MATLELLPPSIDTKTAPPASKAEQGLLEYLDALNEEGKQWKTKCAPDKEDKEALALYRGNYSPTSRSNYFSCDFIQAFIDRQVAALTDNRPIIRVEHRKVGLKNVASASEKVIGGVWQEADMQRQTFKMAHNAAVMRSAGMYVGVDNGDPMVEVVSKEQVSFDPMVKEAALIHKGEYVVIERTKPLAELRLKFPVRARLIKPAEIHITDENAGTTVASPLTALLKIGNVRTPSKSVVDRARIYEAFIRDRQVNAKGDRLFPTWRRIIYSKDVVLWDGPIPYWDGNLPLDWFDWATDPEHPWGISSPIMLKRIQLAFNEIFDGVVSNTVLSNFIQIIGDYDALDQTQWKNLQKITNSLIMRKQGNNQKSLEIVPPPVYGLDKMQVAKQLFTYAQLLTGVTDVTLGDQPGSLQSGTAIQGLQEAAGLMTRARASRLEDFYTRVGSKILARILQFFDSDRVVHLLGPTGEALDYAMNRSELFMDLSKAQMPRVLTNEERRDFFKNLRFAVLPGSSAPGTRARRAEMMMRLRTAGMASRKQVLQAADFQNPDEMLKEAEADFKVFPPPGWVFKGEKEA